MLIIIISKLLLFLLLLLFLALFNGAETAITSLSPSHLKKAKGENKKYLINITFWENKTREVMTAMIIGMNLSLVGMGVVLSSVSEDFSQYYNIDETILDLILPAVSIVLALIFGNIFPKTIGRYNAEKIGITALSLMIKFAKVVNPAVSVLLTISNKIVGGAFNKNESLTVNAAEVDFLLSDARTSPLPLDSRKIISNIMDFTDTRISNVMVSLQEIFAVDIALAKEEIVEKIIKTGYSRVPVFKDNINNILGIIYAKDIAIAWRNSDFIKIQDLIRPAYYVPENAKISETLKEFKTGHIHIAVVVDEFGSTVGIASIEDLLEELVGEVLDEYDSKENDVLCIGKDVYLIQAYESVADLNDALKIGIDEGNYATVNGWVLEIFGKIPKNGDKAIWKEYEIEIQDADSKKVNRIMIRKNKNN
ncbi:MAG: hemolysin family protein [Elusimicrobiota bacterium]|jgi:CBS domain containing-hemolysin-like protein|nr:hemolysin family protein [Elusimicrobiota bacterium]